MELCTWVSSNLSNMNCPLRPGPVQRQRHLCNRMHQRIRQRKLRFVVREHFRRDSPLENRRGGWPDLPRAGGDALDVHAFDVLH